MQILLDHGLNTTTASGSLSATVNKKASSRGRYRINFKAAMIGCQ